MIRSRMKNDDDEANERLVTAAEVADLMGMVEVVKEIVYEKD